MTHAATGCRQALLSLLSICVKDAMIALIVLLVVSLLVIPFPPIKQASALTHLPLAFASVPACAWFTALPTNHSQ